jgi:uncharacterized repeat protein (TIGR03803 family)
VVFEMTKTGGERAIYSFQDGSDGAYPTAGLLNIGGTLYGTATGGGIGAGVVFKVTTAGVETAVYTFQGGTDGSNPAAGLINIGGTLYGTTVSGGNPDCEDEGCGTVFSVTTAGVKTVIYAFNGGTDGATPAASLLQFGDALYGTTTAGGTYSLGTVFKITKAGTEKVVHSFRGNADGCGPQSGLTNVGRALYGTTAGCGAYGNSTVFLLRP